MQPEPPRRARRPSPPPPPRSSRSLIMKRDEGFMFCVDVNPGYFMIKVDNAAGSVLDALSNLASDPTLYVRMRVLDPRPWSQVPPRCPPLPRAWAGSRAGA